jgi:ribosomal protein S18 acetylase RimI-like enzyme
VRIRAAEERDAAAVAALWTEGYANRGPGGRKTPYEEPEFAAAARQGEVFVVDGDEGLAGGEGLAGVVVLYPPGVAGRTAEAEGGEAELSRLVVAERYRGRGVGRALVELCDRLARERGAGALVLWSRPYQVAAHRLYESLGYRRSPQRDCADADGRRLVFVKGLS